MRSTSPCATASTFTFCPSSGSTEVLRDGFAALAAQMPRLVVIAPVVPVDMLMITYSDTVVGALRSSSLFFMYSLLEFLVLIEV